VGTAADDAVCADNFYIGTGKAVQVALQHISKPRVLPRLVVVDLHVLPMHVTSHPDLVLAVRGEKVPVLQNSNGQPDP